MGVFVAIKLPLLIFLVVLLNGVLNGLFAQIFGSGLGFRETAHTILISFAIFAVIVGSLSPVAILFALNTPPPGDPDAGRWHGFTLLAHTAIIAFAGIAANLRMFRLLLQRAPSGWTAFRTFLAWLAGNLFVGAQLAYILRPFFGSPGLEVQFLRDDPLYGNFYIAVYHALQNLAGPEVFPFALMVVGMLLFAGIVVLLGQLAFSLTNHERSKHHG